MAKKNRRKDRTAGKEAGSIDLKKLKREELLEIMLAQSEEIDRLNERVEELEAEVNDRRIRFRKVGSLAEASLAATRYFEEAEKAAALYLENIKRVADRFAAEEAGEAKASKAANVPAPAPGRVEAVSEEKKEYAGASQNVTDVRESRGGTDEEKPETSEKPETQEKPETSEKPKTQEKPEGHEDAYAGAVATVEAFAEVKAEADAEAAAKAGRKI